MINVRLKLIKERARELNSTTRKPLRNCTKRAIGENISVHEMSLLSTIFDLSIEDLTDIILEVMK